PAKRGARLHRLNELAQRPETHIVYVPARNLVDVLSDVVQAMGTERMTSMAREISKQYETIRRDPAGTLLAWVQTDRQQLRGECVLLTAGVDNADMNRPIDPSVLASELAQELPPARAARVLARVSSMTRSEAFDRIERLRKSSTDNTDADSS
ncbi:MAG: hypothetical protein AAGH65_07895, partial [Pseudomonadota bacterium]